jgi:hypothetical protein
MAERNRGRRRLVLAIVTAAGGAGVAFWRRNVAGTGEHVSDVFQAEVPTRATLGTVPATVRPAGKPAPDRSTPEKSTAEKSTAVKPVPPPEEQPRGGFAPEPAKPASLFDPDRS